MYKYPEIKTKSGKLLRFKELIAAQAAIKAVRQQRMLEQKKRDQTSQDHLASEIREAKAIGKAAALGEFRKKFYQNVGRSGQA